MKKSLVLVSLLSMSPGMLYAQGAGVNSDIDAELDQIAASRTAPQAAAPTTSALGTSQVGSGSGSKTIYIVNQATPSAAAQTQQLAQPSQVQRQPEVNVVAAPLTKSRAEQFRDARQQAEVQTENRVVEKLEESRMEDEKRRADALFGGGFQQLQQRNEPVAAPAPAPQPVYQPVQQVPVQPVQPVVVAQPAPQPVVVAPAPVTPKESEEDRRESIRNEVRAALKAEKPVQEETPSIETRYFSAMAGVPDMPDASNVRGNYALGFSFGTTYDLTYQIEGSFTYSDYTVNELNVPQYGYGYGYGGYFIPSQVDTHQYGLSLGGKYLFMDGMIRPTVGGLVQYSYRTYSWAGAGSSYYGSGSSGGGDANSHALDLGVSAGVDFQFNKKFALGADFRYMFNLASRVNQGSNANWFSNYQYFGGKPVEQLQYYTAGIVGKVNF